MNNENKFGQKFFYCAFILFERLKEEGDQKFKAYLDSLPKNVSDYPVFFDDKTLKHLKGSPFLNDINESKNRMIDLYNEICYDVPSFK